MAKKQDEQKTKEQQPAEETKPVTDEQLPEQEPETEAAPEEEAQPTPEEWKKALETAVKQRDEYLAMAQRAQADYQNFKRRNAGHPCRRLRRRRARDAGGSAAHGG